MGFEDHIDEFGGKPVREYDPAEGLQQADAAAHRLRLDWDAGQEGGTVGGSFVAREPRRPPVIPPPEPGFFSRLFGGQRPPKPPPPPAVADRDKDLLVAFLAEAGVEKVTSLIFGMWEDPYDHDSSGIVAGLVAHRNRLPHLKHLFIGEMVMEENEVSWIQQSDISPLWAAYPDLETLRIRGNDGLSLGAVSHARLKSLIIETGGLCQEVVRQVAHADLPSLEHLELWLGAEEYGGDFELKDLQPILGGKLFPKLAYLGLRDSEKADEIAAALATAPVLEQIQTLDLSMGNLSDKGAVILARSAQVRRLKSLDIHYHYVSEEMVKQLQDLGIKVDASDPQEADDDGDATSRYIAVSE